MWLFVIMWMLACVLPTVLRCYIPSLMARLTAIAMVSLLTTFKYFLVFISFSFLFWSRSYTYTIGTNYRISSYSCRGNYSFLEVGVRQLFKGGNYSKEETIDLFSFLSVFLLSLEWANTLWFQVVTQTDWFMLSQTSATRKFCKK